MKVFGKVTHHISGETGSKNVQSPSPVLGEGFRVRVFGKVTHHISNVLSPNVLGGHILGGSVLE